MESDVSSKILEMEYEYGAEGIEAAAGAIKQSRFNDEAEHRSRSRRLKIAGKGEPEAVNTRIDFQLREDVVNARILGLAPKNCGNGE